MNRILYLYKSLKFNKIINKSIANFSKEKYIVNINNKNLFLCKCQNIIVNKKQ